MTGFCHCCHLEATRRPRLQKNLKYHYLSRKIISNCKLRITNIFSKWEQYGTVWVRTDYRSNSQLWCDWVSRRIRQFACFKLKIFNNCRPPSLNFPIVIARWRPSEVTIALKKKEKNRPSSGAKCSVVTKASSVSFSLSSQLEVVPFKLMLLLLLL